MTKFLGLLGSVCFGFCGIPASFATLKQGKSVGTPISIAWMIFLGSIFMYSYLYRSYGFDLLLALNYGIEVLSWGLIVYYHYFPRKQQLKLSEVSFDDFRGFPEFSDKARGRKFEEEYLDVQDTVEK